MAKTSIRRTVALATLALAMQATGAADDIVPDTDEGWTLTPTCTTEAEIAKGKRAQCWSSTTAWNRNNKGETYHAADVSYNCEIGPADEGYYGHLYLYTETRKGNLRTEPPVIIKTRWDDEEEVHEVPVDVLTGKVKGKTNKRRYWFSISGATVKGTLARLAAHERLHIEWPKAKKRNDPIWVSANLANAIEAIRTNAERCGGGLAEALFAPPDSEGT